MAIGLLTLVACPVGDGGFDMDAVFQTRRWCMCLSGFVSVCLLVYWSYLTPPHLYALAIFPSMGLAVGHLQKSVHNPRPSTWMAWAFLVTGCGFVGESAYCAELCQDPDECTDFCEDLGSVDSHIVRAGVWLLGDLLCIAGYFLDRRNFSDGTDGAERTLACWNVCKRVFFVWGAGTVVQASNTIHQGKVKRDLDKMWLKDCHSWPLECL
jgi:hypothetical protein